VRFGEPPILLGTVALILSPFARGLGLLPALF
jgi:hypothetical protein